MTTTPEALARERIDTLLTAAGWTIQHPDQFNRNAALGVAVREFQLPNGAADYLLFVDGKACGLIEAKKAGVTLTGVAEQAAKYRVLPEFLAQWPQGQRFVYLTTGAETLFCDHADPEPRSRRVFAFHKPETLLGWLKDDSTLRQRLTHMPPLQTAGLRDCQVDAITGLETSLAKDKPRSLIQMATGAGKTFTACTFSWRLLKHARARRILFLVDRNNLGDQTLKEYQNFDPPSSAHKFTQTYITQHLSSNRLDPDAQVVITTIQRLYAMLRGKELDENAEQRSAFETWTGDEPDGPAPVPYNPVIPIEHFDFIVTDECHRSIYGLWRQVLEYFDAHLIGLTATPSKHTLAFFNQNLVAEYPYEQSVIDGVNVGYEVYRIKTQVSEQGGVVNADYAVPLRDKRTRALRYAQLDDDLPYAATELDRAVTVPAQIRAVLQCYRDRMFTELFPGRSGQWVPKTLIFAKDDNHAEEITHIVREVFDAGDDFAKKITYQTSEKPKELIRAFRVDPFPRIAITVDMIATGTDIKPVECVIFMRDVKSEGYYEQMKGRGVRTINDADLAQVTPDARTKTRFVLIDAVGVTEGRKSVSQPLERKRGVTFEKLLEQIAQGRRDDDALSSLAGRLAALDHQIEDDDRARVTQSAGGLTLKQLARQVFDAVDPDMIQASAIDDHGPEPTDEQITKVTDTLKDTACQPLDNPDLRKLLVAIKKKSEIVIDDQTTDALISGTYDKAEAEKRVDSFKSFIEQNRDELLALQILYNQPYGTRRLSYAAVRELAQALGDPPWHLTTATVWQAYARLNAAVVRGAPTDKLLTDIIALVRFATGQTDVLEPYAVQVEQKFNLWMGRQKKAGRAFTAEQDQWLRAIKDYLIANLEIEARDLMQDQPFAAMGGVLHARELFGEQLNALLDELSGALAA
ncbi:DEAD/DEAH box helicase family protein [uncultured Abyssibacter sp.]|uniref:type I restriction endonuclease subunit R n=1 Tax=uncultured Abyssibacter sp. TaxID=2320202 RepID=UPI0032B1063D